MEQNTLKNYIFRGLPFPIISRLQCDILARKNDIYVGKLDMINALVKWCFYSRFSITLFVIYFLSLFFYGKENQIFLAVTKNGDFIRVFFFL